MSIHRRGSDLEAAAEVEISGCRLSTLSSERHDFSSLFDTTFEEVLSRLSQFPRLFIEPDGSFVWRGGSGDLAWQLDGQLFDRNDRLQHVELHGTLSLDELDQFLAALGGPTTRFVFQLMREAYLLDEVAFRKYLGSRSTGV